MAAVAHTLPEGITWYSTCAITSSQCAHMPADDSCEAVPPAFFATFPH